MLELGDHEVGGFFVPVDWPRTDCNAPDGLVRQQGPNLASPVAGEGVWTWAGGPMGADDDEIQLAAVGMH